MAFKPVADLSTDSAIALGGFNKKLRKDNPTTVTGYFLGSKEIDSPMSKTGKAFLHVFQTAQGNLGVWGKTDMDRKLRAATVGAMTRVTYTGQQEIKGKNPMYKYSVEVDADDVIEVTASTGASDTSDNSDDYSQDSEDDVDAPTPPPVSAKAPSDAARRSASNLLQGRK
jgi:hypothetical protein